MNRYLLILGAGLFAQYIDGTLGMGYGASSSSFLLAAGFTPVAVSASVHAAELVASLAAGVSHWKLGNVDKRVALPLTCGGMVGGACGAYFLASIDGGLIKPYIALLLLAVGVRILIIHLGKRAGSPARTPPSRKFLIPLGLVGGAVDAIGGGGWGPICTPTLVSTNSSEPRVVVGSVNAAEVLTTLAITLTFAFTLGLEKFLWGITLPLMVGGIIAAPLSAIACRRIPPGSLGVAIGVVLIILNVRALAPAISGVVGIDPPLKLDSVVVFAVLALGLGLLLIRSLTAKQRVADEEAS